MKAISHVLSNSSLSFLFSLSFSLFLLFYYRNIFHPTMHRRLCSRWFTYTNVRCATARIKYHSNWIFSFLSLLFPLLFLTSSFFPLCELLCVRVCVCVRVPCTISFISANMTTKTTLMSEREIPMRLTHTFCSFSTFSSSSCPFLLKQIPKWLFSFIPLSYLSLFLCFCFLLLRTLIKIIIYT